MKASFPPNTSIFLEGTQPHLLYATMHKNKATNMSRLMHKHKNIAELLYIYSGSGVYSIGESSYDIDEGDILFYNSDDLHEVTSYPDTAIGAYCFGIDNLYIKGLPANHLVPSHGPFILSSPTHKHIFNSISNLIYTQLEEKWPTSDELCSHLLSSLIIFCTSLIENPNGSGNTVINTFAENIKSYIDNHYTEYISLEVLGKALGKSPYHVAHVFKEYTGYSPIQYAIRLRLGEAQSLLINNNFTITQIATMVGYDNTNYFTTLFTKMIGVSPSQYRADFLQDIKGKYIKQ